METITFHYEMSHGKSPRGFGTWFLTLTGTDGKGRYTKYDYYGTGKLTDVRKRACAAFKSEVGGIKKITECIVQP